MKKWWLLAALLAPAFLMTGCEFPGTEDDDDDDEVTFENKSTYDVTVTPQSSGWRGFSFAPGEEVKVEAADVFFTYEPRFRVTVGDESGGRILFINLKENTVQADTSGD